MKQKIHQIATQTRGKGLYNITREVEAWATAQEFQTGILTVFVPHTSASLVIQENADPDVLRDLNAFFARLVPDGDPAYRHTAEGPDDMPAHIRSALTQTQIGIPLVDGRLGLGVWQGIYLFEHRSAPHKRRVTLHLIGE
ncbi:MAG: YjbQ family protein [Nitrospinae bacterium]|nr:YjbQ family protein [Nitrospinota bacterium]